MVGSLRTINSSEIWVDEVGAGPLVVCIHGLGGTSQVFHAQALALAHTHRVISFDLTGHGMSPQTTTTTVDSWARDVVALLDLLDEPSCSLVAHSLGTLVAQQVLSLAPDRIHSAVLLGPVRDLPTAARQAQHERAELVEGEGMASVADAISQGALSEKTRSEQPAVVGFVKELLLRQPPRGYAAACRALGDSAPPDVSAFKGRLLAVTGSDDGVSPADKIDDFVANFADASSFVINGIGHWTSLEATTKVTELIVEFLGATQETAPNER